ncbi:hypothetical protein FQR65_LT14599 [Abscondita terminalis]|nr:hypothetical protein FQR65_LT14599 [Abscondita terminalis]
MSFIWVLVAFALSGEVSGHGMMLEPVNRGSRWRYNATALPNYSDMGLFCGGYSAQWVLNAGKCGVCGDNYEDPVPRDNENTGLYGEGVMVERYLAGSVVNVTVLLTQNHRGSFSFSLCRLVNSSLPEEEDCFRPVLFLDGSDKVTIAPGNGNFTYQVRLPEGITCEHCVFRWNYRTGNSWGVDEDGTSCLGCGPQETFRNCADVAIY